MQHRGVGGWVRQAGPEGEQSVQAAGSPEGSAEGMQPLRNRVEFKGQAERSVEDASRRQDREAEPEMQQPESDVWFVRQG
jgi:spore coat protein CotH